MSVELGVSLVTLVAIGKIIYDTGKFRGVIETKIDSMEKQISTIFLKINGRTETK